MELTWVAKLRQWRKRRNVGGKRKDFYLGTGSGPDDRDSYRRALGKWKVIEAELDALKAAETLQQKYEKWVRCSRPARGRTASPTSRWYPSLVHWETNLILRLSDRWKGGRGWATIDRPPRPSPKSRRWENTSTTTSRSRGNGTNTA